MHSNATQKLSNDSNENASASGKLTIGIFKDLFHPVIMEKLQFKVLWKNIVDRNFKKFFQTLT